MSINKAQRPFPILVIVMMILSPYAFGSTAKLWINPRCHPLDVKSVGQMVELPGGDLLTIGKNKILKSKDNGKTWIDEGPMYGGPAPGMPNNAGVLIRTRDGVIVLVYMDMSTFKWGWNKTSNGPDKDIRLDVWAIRSLDNGKTWIDRQEIMHGYCGALITIIQTRRGRIVVPVQNMDQKLGRNVTFTCTSDDDGKTWQRSNVIDLGGHGSHDGAFESTLAQLKDGRLWMLIRTSLDRFWQAYSNDDGASWRVIEPSAIDASSSPGDLLRLQSGRLVLVWNRLYREGQHSIQRRDQDLSERPASWQRDELSIAFSNNDGETWTKPVVIARKKNGNLSYPYVLERRRGLLWIFAGGGVRLELREGDLIRD